MTDLVTMGTKEAALKTPVIIEGRNLFEPERMKAKGIEYYAIWRGLSVVGGCS